MKNLFIYISVLLLLGCQPISDYGLFDKNMHVDKYYSTNFIFYNDINKKQILTLEKLINMPAYAFVKKVIIVENQIENSTFKDYKTACENYMTTNPEPRMLCYQDEELEALKFFNTPENYIIINVSKNLQFKGTSNYYTPTKVSTLLQKNHTGFKISILHVKNGKIILQSDKPIDAQSLVKLLQTLEDDTKE